MHASASRAVWRGHGLGHAPHSVAVLLSRSRTTTAAAAATASALERLADGTATVKRSNFFDKSVADLEADMEAMNLPAYRADQLWRAVYQFGILDWSKMTTLSPKLKEVLAHMYTFGMGRVQSDLTSSDGTRKWLVEYGSHGQGAVETVFIPEMNRGTACVSSQVGCSLSCKFCHTGTMDKSRLRNLTSGEIVAQVMQQRLSMNDFPSTRGEHFVSNIVMMGMGEPLYNYRNVKKAIETLMHSGGLSFSRRKITLSTSGVVPLIVKLGEDLGVSLAISLHAVNNDLRNELVPINKTYNLESLLEACRNYPTLNFSRKITFEYVMLKNVNDSLADARELVRILKGIPSLVNLIPFNPWPGSDYECSSEEQILSFARALDGQDHLKVTIRWPRGRDIMAACGQLANHKDSSEKTEGGAATA